MPLNTSNEPPLSLAQKTYMYWCLSSTYNNRIETKNTTTIDHALKETGVIINFTGPNRLLRKVTEGLQHEMIVKGGRRKSRASNTTIKPSA